MKILKSILFSTIIVVLIFTLLEASQRVRYYLKTKDIEYLCYGHSGIEIHLENFIFYIKRSLSKLQNKPGNNVDAKVVLKIDAFGGSTTNNGAMMPKFQYPLQMEALIKEKYPGLTVEVINRGVKGAYSDDILRNMQRAYSHFTDIPDVAIVFTGLNDAAIKMGHYRNKKRYVPVSFLNSLDKSICKYSLFYSVLKEYLMNKKFGNLNSYYSQREAQEIKIDYNLSSEEESNYVNRDIIPEFIANINTVVKLCRALNIKIVFGTEPYSNKALVKFPAEIKILDRLSKELKDIAERNNIPLVDAQKYFKSLKNGDGYFDGGQGADCVHLGPDGNRILAGLFLDALEKNDLLKKK